MTNSQVQVPNLTTPDQVVNSALEAGEKSLDLYNKTADQLIPWDEFKDIMDKLARHEKDYSNQAGQIVGKIKTLLLDSHDQYLKATQSVFEWCSLTSALLQAYLDLFEDYNEEKAESQKIIILKVLKNGIDKMNAAQNSLGSSSMSFNEASGQISLLRTQLSNDFDNGSSYFKHQVDKIRKEAYAGAGAGIIFGPFGLIVSEGIAAGVVEGKLIPELLAKFKEVQKHFDEVKELVSKANKDINETKTKLQNEIEIIGDIRVKTEETSLYIKINSLRERLRKSATNLITLCQMYMKRHHRGARVTVSNTLAHELPGDYQFENVEIGTIVMNSKDTFIFHWNNGRIDAYGKIQSGTNKGELNFPDHKKFDFEFDFSKKIIYFSGDKSNGWQKI